MLLLAYIEYEDLPWISLGAILIVSGLLAATVIIHLLARRTRYGGKNRNRHLFANECQQCGTEVPNRGILYPDGPGALFLGYVSATMCLAIFSHLILSYVWPQERVVTWQDRLEWPRSRAYRSVFIRFETRARVPAGGYYGSGQLLDRHAEVLANVGDEPHKLEVDLKDTRCRYVDAESQQLKKEYPYSSQGLLDFFKDAGISSDKAGVAEEAQMLMKRIQIFDKEALNYSFGSGNHQEKWDSFFGRLRQTNKPVHFDSIELPDDTISLRVTNDALWTISGVAVVLWCLLICGMKKLFVARIIRETSM